MSRPKRRRKPSGCAHITPSTQIEGSPRGLIESLTEGFAYCKIILDDNGHPADWIHLAVNHAFERLIGRSDLIDKRAREVFPGIEVSDAKLLEICGRVALTGQPEKFDIKVEAIGKSLTISASSPDREHFVLLCDDISNRKQAELALETSKWDKLASAIARILRPAH